MTAQPAGWNQIGLDIDGEGAGDTRVSLSADGTIFAVSALRALVMMFEFCLPRLGARLPLEWQLWNQLGNDIDRVVAGKAAAPCRSPVMVPLSPLLPIATTATEATHLQMGWNRLEPTRQ